MWKRKPRPKSLPFTEQQIQAKAYEIWQARGGKGGSSEDDWQQAIADLKLAASQPNGRKRYLESFGSKDDREFALKVKQFHWERLKTIISAVGLAATIFAGIGLYLTYKTGQEQQQLAREQQQQGAERLITERFAKAVEQLGSPQLDVRIGAIYSLERLAKDSPKDHWTIMEVLTAFVRNHSPMKKTPEVKKTEIVAVTSDVQSTLTVIGRRDAKNDLQKERLNLSETNLSKAFLNHASLQWANLSNADLQEADLFDANLQEAVLSNANLQRARLILANLQGAVLMGNLQGINLDGANLQRAVLVGNLQEAVLSNANLQEAVLSNANLQRASLIHANLQGAVLLATDFRQTEGLTQQQLVGKNPPLLCNVALPKNIKVNPNRDCDRLPQELVKRNPTLTIESAKQMVNDARQYKWK